MLGFALMASQAVLYNATLFGMTSIMTTFFHASKANAPLYIIPFAVGNLLGPWLLGPLFDTVGRKVDDLVDVYRGRRDRCSSRRGSSTRRCCRRRR